MEAAIRKALHSDDFEPPHLYDGVTIDRGPVSIGALASGLGLVYGAAFQIGYFIKIGVEFLPLMGALDLLFPAAALLTFMFLWYPLAEFGYRHVNRRMTGGDIERSYFFFLATRYFRYELAIFWAAVVVLIIYGVDFSLAFPWLGLACLFYFSTIMFCHLRDNARRLGLLLPSNCLWFCIHSVMLSVTLGALYAGHFAGRHCWFRTNPSFYWDAVYLRGVGDGHLLRKAGRTVFLNKSDVKEITCGLFQPERKSGEPLTGGN